MAGVDENVGAMGEWGTPNSSPKTLFSSMIGEDFGSKSFSELLTENEKPEREPEKQKVTSDDQKDGGDGFSGGNLLESSVFEDHNPFSRGNGGGLAARMAARAGFNAPRLNTARIQSANLNSNGVSPSPEVSSPYLMIPAGLSPTTLLDSPVFLSNSQAQLSPTTGTLPCNQKSSLEAPDTNKDQFFKDIGDSSFAFKPHIDSSSVSVVNKGTSTTDHRNPLPGTEAMVQPEHPFQDRNLEGSNNHSQTQTRTQNQEQYHLQVVFPEPYTRKENARVADNIIGGTESNPAQTNPSITADHSPSLDEGEGDQKVEFPPAIGAPAEDGYNWRKYGQKQVKGSEYPRSYYKCTHSTCPVKKKVERSHDGHITEIIYKGAHNHPKPPPTRRSAVGSMPLENLDNHGGPMSVDGESIWEGKQHGTAVGAIEWRNNGMETTSSASTIREFCNASTSMQVQNGTHLELADALEVPSALSDEEEDDDRGTHGSTSMGDDGDCDESESKRRKKDTCVMDVSAASRAIREPRVVVQTTSEVDILDDGYRWRKYGQKVVKGNPNPRSYYKCTNAGCTVRKHVERASHDLKSVITTYEGKHNHDVPAARNISHVNSGSNCAAPAPAAQTHIHRPEPSQIHDMARFDRLGNFGLIGRQQLESTTGFSFTMSQPHIGSSMALGGLDQSQGKLPVLPMQSYLGQAKAIENGFLMPKSEFKEEPGLPGSNTMAYHQMLSRLPPLGHQM